MRDFIKTKVVDGNSFYDDRKVSSLKTVTSISKDMFPSIVSYKNAVKFLDDYDVNNVYEKVLLTYEIYQPKKGKNAKGFQLFVKLKDDLYNILDRRESSGAGAGQLLVSYMNGNGTKVGSIQFHQMNGLFDGISNKYDKTELIEELTISPEARELFIF